MGRGGLIQYLDRRRRGHGVRQILDKRTQRRAVIGGPHEICARAFHEDGSLWQSRRLPLGRDEGLIVESYGEGYLSLLEIPITVDEGPRAFACFGIDSLLI